MMYREYTFPRSVCSKDSYCELDHMSRLAHKTRKWIFQNKYRIKMMDQL